MNAKPFPWEQAIGVALGILRMPPDAFWRMTPRELACAIEALNAGRSKTLERADFELMMTRFPDGR